MPQPTTKAYILAMKATVRFYYGALKRKLNLERSTMNVRAWAQLLAHLCPGSSWASDMVL